MSAPLLFAHWSLYWNYIYSILFELSIHSICLSSTFPKSLSWKLRNSYLISSEVISKRRKPAQPGITFFYATVGRLVRNQVFIHHLQLSKFDLPVLIIYSEERTFGWKFRLYWHQKSFHVARVQVLQPSASFRSTSDETILVKVVLGPSSNSFLFLNLQTSVFLSPTPWFSEYSDCSSFFCLGTPLAK